MERRRMPRNYRVERDAIIQRWYGGNPDIRNPRPHRSWRELVLEWLLRHPGQPRCPILLVVEDNTVEEDEQHVGITRGVM